MSQLNVCVVTGSRADFGLLRELMHLIKNDNTFSLSTIVTGSHLSPVWGDTYKDIERAGFKIEAKIETLLSSDSLIGTAKSLGMGVIGFADFFSYKRPDFIIVLGDRFEIFAAVQAAYCLKIPIVHLHGGEVTKGALDDYFRHAITKASSLHFVAHEAYARRVIQLGEEPASVNVVGALGIDLIKNIRLYSRQEFASELGIELLREYILVGYHPATLANNNAEEEKKAVSNIMRALDNYQGFDIVITLANADANGYSINEHWKKIAEKNSKRIHIFSHLGSEKYLNAIHHSKMIVGNSSSGILEAPYFNKPTINIGERQEGRIMPSSVINCSYDSTVISEAIARALSPEWLRENISGRHLIYGEPGKVASKIISVLKQANLKEFKYKSFYDVPN